MIEAKAHFDAPERIVHIRVGGLDGRLYLDLGDETWRAVEIDATGWRVIDNPPVRFRRAAGMQPLPMPVPGGSVETLRSFLNVQSDTDFVLVVAWALACLRNRGPYPVIVLSGEQGSAKSTFSAILRALLDPNTAPLRALPREDRDLFIAASNGHVLAFDNVSGLPAWISDTLCRLATGGGFAVRQLYTDQDEVLFDAARPVILNGIEDIVTRPDLADRAVFLTLEPIPEERRRPEAELWAAFEAERPRILGVLLDAVVEGLKRLPETQLDEAAAHGGLRAVGDGLRDGALARRHLLVGLLRQPRRGGGGRDRRRSDRRRRARRDGDADGVDGNRLGPSGRPWRRWRASASPSPRPGRIARGRWRAGCAGRRPSCARSASRSASSARAGRGPAPSASPPPRTTPRQKTPGRNRPHRPHRPRPCRNPIRPTASRQPDLRTVANDADGSGGGTAPDRPRQPLEIQW